MSRLFIGVDCATDAAKVGLARGTEVGAQVVVDDLVLCDKESGAAARMAKWLTEFSGSAVIAIDAPLGWPTPLRNALVAHRAGDEIPVDPNHLFRRATDRFVQQRLKKTPLDVGADRIARTAHAALRMLGDLRRLLNQPVPLGWAATDDGTVAIEVYPAATLISRGVRSSGYKKPVNIEERREIIEALAAELSLGDSRPQAERNADALDAAICLLAAADFVNGRALRPESVDAVAAEGWIWTAPPRVPRA